MKELPPVKTGLSGPSAEGRGNAGSSFDSDIIVNDAGRDMAAGRPGAYKPIRQKQTRAAAAIANTESVFNGRKQGGPLEKEASGKGVLADRDCVALQ